MLRLVSFLMTASSGFVAAGDVAPMFTARTANAVGSADRHGYLCWWHDVPASLDIVGEKLPLAFRFCTAPESNVGRIFGDNWWCPILEGSVIERSERMVSASTPGGSMISLSRDGDEPGHYRSKDLKWTGVQERNEFVLRNGATTLVFKDGRISSYTDESKRRYRWDYAQGRPVAIIDVATGKPVVQAAYDDKGLVSSLAASGKTYKMRYDSLPKLTSGIAGVGTAVGGIAPALAGIEIADRSLLDLHYTLSEDQSQIQMSGKREDAVSKQTRAFRYDWKGLSGLVQSDDKLKYQLESHTGGSRRPTVMGIDDKGRVQSYNYNEKTGVAEIKRPNGTVEQRIYLLTPGQTYGKIRSVKIDGDGDGTPNSVSIAEFDRAGKKLRTVSRNDSHESVRIYADGKLVSWKQNGRSIIADGKAVSPVLGGIMSHLQTTHRTSPDKPNNLNPKQAP